MVDAFVGTWKLVDTANFDEYMKALGEWARLRAGLESHHLFFFFFTPPTPPICVVNPPPPHGGLEGGVAAAPVGGLGALRGFVHVGLGWVRGLRAG